MFPRGNLETWTAGMVFHAGDVSASLYLHPAQHLPKCALEEYNVCKVNTLQGQGVEPPQLGGGKPKRRDNAGTAAAAPEKSKPTCPANHLQIVVCCYITACYAAFCTIQAFKHIWYQSVLFRILAHVPRSIFTHAFADYYPTRYGGDSVWSTVCLRRRL
jgi:hypothetical protein